MERKTSSEFQTLSEKDNYFDLDLGADQQATQKSSKTKRDAGFVDYWKLDYRTTTAKLTKMVIPEFEKIEFALKRAGYNLETGGISSLPITDPKRIVARDELVFKYNREFAGLRTPLKNSLELGQSALQKIADDIGADFSDPSVLQLTKKFIAGFGAGIFIDATTYPIASIASFLIGGSLYGGILRSVAGNRFASSLLGKIAVDGLSYASFKQATFSDDIVKKQILEGSGGEDKRLETFAKDVALVASTSAVLRSLAIGASKAKNTLFSATKHNKKIIDKAFRDATVPERAAIYDQLVELYPNSTIMPLDKKLAEAEIKELGTAIMKQDAEAISRILEREGISAIPDKIVSGKKVFPDADPEILKNRILSNDEFIEKVKFNEKKYLIKSEILTADENKRFTELINERATLDISNIGKRESIADTAYGILEEGYGRYVGRTTNTINEEIAKKAAEEISRLATEHYFADRRSIDYAPEAFTAIKDAIQGNIKKILLENKTNRATIDRILSQNTETQIARPGIQLSENTQEYIKNIRKARRQLDTADYLLTVVANSSTIKTGWKQGNSLSNNLRNSINNLTETITTAIKNDIRNVSKEIIDVVRNSTKDQFLSDYSLDLAQLYDAVSFNKGTGTLEGSVGSILKKNMQLWGEEMARHGMFATPAEPTLPNFLDPKKLYKISKEKFVSTAIGLVDQEKMIETALKRNAPIKDMEKFLGNIYENARANRSSRSVKTVDGGAISSGDRIIFFKSGADWVKFHNEFGKDLSTHFVIKRTLEQQKRRRLLGSLGISNSKEGATLVKQIIDATKIISSRKPLEKGSTREAFNSALQTVEKQFLQIIDDMVNPHTGDITQNPVLSSLVTFKRNSLLSTSSVTAFFTDLIGSSGLLSSALGNKNNRLNVLINAISLLSTAEKRKFLAINAYSNNIGLALLEGNTISRFAKTAINMPLLLTEWVSGVTEANAKMMFGMVIEDNSGKTFDKIPMKLKSFLRNHGIEAADWEIYRKTPSMEIEYGIKTKLSLYSAKDIPEEIAIKFGYAETGSALLGAPRPTAVGSTARAKSLDPATNVITYITQPFVNTSYSVFLTHYAQITEYIANKSFGDIGLVIGQLLLGGYLTLQTKRILKGENIKKKRDPMSDFLLSAMYGNITGAYGDVIIESLLDFSSTFPEKKLLEQIGKTAVTRNTKGLYKAFSDTALSYQPYKNFGLAGQIMHKYTIDKWFMLLDPEGYEYYQNSIQKKIENGKLQPWAAKALLQEPIEKR